VKRIFKSVLINSIAFYFASALVKGLQFSGGFATILISGLAFAIINALVKPIVSLFLLPFNLVTLGLFSWVINVIMLYILTVAIPDIKMISWQFTGFSSQGFVVPQMYFSSLQTLIIASFIISFITGIINWVIKD